MPRFPCPICHHLVVFLPRCPCHRADQPFHLFPVHQTPLMRPFLPRCQLLSPFLKPPATNVAPLPPPTNDPGTTLSGITEEKGYNELWAKRSEKPLQQIYGHIDRISNKEAGSLLVVTLTASAIRSIVKSL